MILLQKGRGEYKVIGIVEVIWNMTTTIINTRLRVVISCHDDLHEF